MKKLDLNEKNKKKRVKMWGRCGRDHVLSLKYLHNQILSYEKEYEPYMSLYKITL